MNQNKKRKKKEEKQEENPEQRRRSMIILGAILVVLFLIIGIMSIVENSEDHTGEVQIPDTPSALKDMKYQEAVEAFEENGFTNVQAEPLEDLITGLFTKEDEVDTVTVDGSDSFSSGKWVQPDVEVVISYHSFPITEDTEEQEESVEAEKSEEPEEETDDTDSSEQASPSTGNDTQSSNSGNTSNSNNSTKATKGTQESLEEKLGVSYAWAAMEMRGKEEYPYGFTLHYVTGVLAEKAEDENTWFLKAKCTYTNAFGAETDGNCEARVTGTSDNPKITYFVVY